VKWFRKAAHSGNLYAQAKLAAHYISGMGCREDYAEALRLAQDGAKKGEKCCQYLLGCLYLEGASPWIEKDKTHAHDWLQKAADQGLEDARKKIKELESVCFISTAVAESLDWSDDCHELNLLRQLRDTYMQETPDRRAEVEKYYRIAPAIVRRINASPDAAEIWHEVAEQYVLPVVRMAKAGDVAGAHILYRRMVNELRAKWLASSAGAVHSDTSHIKKESESKA